MKGYPFAAAGVVIAAGVSLALWLAAPREVAPEGGALEPPPAREFVSPRPRRPLAERWPTPGDVGAADELTPQQRRGLERLMRAYARARELVDDVERSRPVETERFEADGQGLVSAVKSKMGEMAECFQAWLALNPETGGEIDTQIVIEASPDRTTGRVVDIIVNEGELGNVFLEGCVFSSLLDLQFEPPPGGRVELRHGFVFVAIGYPKRP